MLFEPSRIASQLERLADEHSVYLGTTSWKYPGWCGILYDEDNYFWGKHFSKARFNRNCLEEYARVFRSVCVDATYYRLPTDDFLESLATAVPENFRFTFKVPDEITIRTFPNVTSFGKRRGQTNEYFLNEGVFNFGFLRHLEKIRKKVGLLVFEFSHFHASDFDHGRDFVAAIDAFFETAPGGWQYGVEVRNRNLLHPEYFEMLTRHGVIHVYNHWTRMPSVSEQLELRPAASQPFVGARYLLTPERSMDWAEREFAPYNQLREIDPGARQSLRTLLDGLIESAPNPDLPSYLYVGNQLEGNALHTIADVLEGIFGSEE